MRFASTSADFVSVGKKKSPKFGKNRGFKKPKRTAVEKVDIVTSAPADFATRGGE